MRREREGRNKREKESPPRPVGGGGRGAEGGRGEDCWAAHGMLPVRAVRGAAS